MNRPDQTINWYSSHPQGYRAEVGDGTLKEGTTKELIAYVHHLERQLAKAPREVTGDRVDEQMLVWHSQSNKWHSVFTTDDGTRHFISEYPSNFSAHKWLSRKTVCSENLYIVKPKPVEQKPSVHIDCCEQGMVSSGEDHAVECPISDYVTGDDINQIAQESWAMAAAKTAETEVEPTPSQEMRALRERMNTEMNIWTAALAIARKANLPSGNSVFLVRVVKTLFFQIYDSLREIAQQLEELELQETPKEVTALDVVLEFTGSDNSGEEIVEALRSKGFLREDTNA